LISSYSSGAVEQYLGSDYVRAAVDPIARQSRSILDKINAQYQQELKTLCLEYGDVAVDEVFIMGLDRFAAAV
jgi:glycerol kinase